MTDRDRDRVFPSSKPPPTATTTTANATPATNGVPAATAVKPQTYNPTTRHPYRPQPHYRRTPHRRSGRRICCCCCFWTILIFLILALVATIALTALYVLYHPKTPTFSIPSLRIHRLNLTTSADSSTSSLSSLFNLTLISKNTNSHFTFAYEPFAISAYSGGNVFLGNGTVPGFFSDNNNQTAFRAIVLASTAARDLDADELTQLRSDLRRKNGLEIRIQMDTKVKIQTGKLKSKRVGIRVVCDGFRGAIPRGKTPTVATHIHPKCKVDLRIKIWKLVI